MLLPPGNVFEVLSSFLSLLFYSYEVRPSFSCLMRTVLLRYPHSEAESNCMFRSSFLARSFLFRFPLSVSPLNGVFRAVSKSHIMVGERKTEKEKEDELHLSNGVEKRKPGARRKEEKVGFCEQCVLTYDSPANARCRYVVRGNNNKKGQTRSRLHEGT